MATPVREFFGGVGLLLRGAEIVIRRPRLFLLGALPALVTSLLFLAALVALLVNIADLVVWMSPFAEGWQPLWQGALRIVLGVAIVAAAVLVMVVAFTTVTLALGSPIYDKIAELVEDELGDAPEEAEDSAIRSVFRGIRQSLTVVLVSLLITVAVFLAGLLPFAGTVLGPLLGAALGGWVLAVELVGNAFDRRGLHRLSERHAHLRRHRARVLGFAAPTYLLLAIPFLAVAVFPAATAGGTLLARQILQETPPAPA